MADQQHETIQIRGMSCGHCVRAVEEALTDVDGLVVERVEIGSAEVRYDPERVDAAAIRSAVEEAGFEPA